MNDLVCECRIDYSTIEGDRVLPFIISLNEEKSIFYPKQGELQTFCYDLIGVGMDTSKYADLSHFLLQVCDEMEQSDIEKVTVCIDDAEKTVVWGENVEFKTREKPDKPTGGVGLKFDFGLDKVTGDMQVCFVLKKEYNIGPMNVWLYGGGFTVNGLEICGPIAGEKKGSCEYVFHQKETVSVPVQVTPYAEVGITKVSCSGSPIIRIGEQSVRTQCPACKEACNFSISQNLMVEIPISFGAGVEIGEAIIQCGSITDEGCSCNI